MEDRVVEWRRGEGNGMKEMIMDLRRGQWNKKEGSGMEERGV